jgi:hypothetical protein
MTSINPLRTVRREMKALVRDRGMREIIVGLQWPNLLTFRGKGNRRTYSLTAEWCYMQAARIAGESLKRERAAARKGKRKGKG